MISLHFIVDFADDARLQRGLDYLVRTQQRTVNIAGGAQLDRAIAFADKVRAALPNIVIMFRILEDTGIIIKLSPADWYTKFVAPRLEWLQKQKIVLVIDNETSGDDKIISTYVERESLVLDMLHAVHLNGAVCRFATGNIAESQYQLLKPLLEKLQPLDWVSPNEYSNAPGKSSGGHLERYKRIEAVVGHSLNIAIGECGVLVDYKARAGYRSINMAGKDMAAQLIGEEIWYRGGTIPRHYYCIGGNQDWISMQAGDDVLSFWEDYYAKNPFSGNTPPVVVTPTPSPTPAPSPTPVPASPPPTPIPAPPPEPTVTIPVSVLQAVRTSLFLQANATRSLALQLAGISDDMLGDIKVLDSIIQKANAK